MGIVKLAKNLQCPCGSGLKYKHCCWDKDHAQAPAEKSKLRRSVWEDDEEAGGGGRFGFADAIVTYAKPLLEKAGKEDQGIRKALTLGALFWNVAQMKEHQRKKEIEDIARKLSRDKEDNAAFYELADFMLDRYERMFGSKRRLVCPDCGGPLEECPPAGRTRLPPRWLRVLLFPAVVIWAVFSSVRRRLRPARRRRGARITSS